MRWSGGSHRRFRLLAAIAVAGAGIAGTVSSSEASVAAPFPIVRALAAVSSAPGSVVVPVVSGVAQQGLTLVGSSGSWSGVPAPSLSFQWVRCDQFGAGCVAIAGASSSSYLLVAADVGFTVAVVVTGSNGSGSASAQSAVTGVVTAPAPLTGVLDDFNRADTSGGLPGPSWATAGFVGNGATNLSVVGQQATGAANIVAGDYWAAQQFGPDSEAFVTVAAKSSVDLDIVSLGLRFSNPSVAAASGYQAFFYNRSGTDEYRIVKRVNGQLTLLAYVLGPELQAGDQLLFRAVGSTLSLSLGHAGAWRQVASASDTTFAGAGYAALIIRNPYFRTDNFGAGTLP